MIGVYLWLYGLTFAACFLLTPVITLLAERLRIVDLPDARKIHVERVARLGGAAFVLVWLGAVTWLYLTGQFGPGNSRLVPGLIIGCALIALVGVADDWRGLPSRVKLLLQTAAALVFLMVGAPTAVSNGLWFAVALFWLVLITNAFNLIDGLDGLAIGLAAVAATGFAVLGFIGDGRLLFLSSLALLGVCLSFLPYNWYPARVFMGDVGSHFLGFALASLGLIALADKNQTGGLVVPLLFMAVPVFDTALSIIRRILNKKPLFAADKSHFYNLLMNRGLSHRGSVLFCYGLASAFATAGLVLGPVLPGAAGSEPATGRGHG